MPGINSTRELEPGDLFTINGKDVWECTGWCNEPTVHMRNIRTGETTGGAVGCLNLSKFIKLKPEENGNAR